MRIVCILFFLLGAVAAGEAHAAEIEQLFMPGKLISGHAEFESECTNCHVRLRDTTQKKLCLDCHDHKPVAEDIRSRKGFHGKFKDARELDCKTCHSDHKGRDASLIQLNRDRFDHRFTDFPLKGKHLLVECDSCHLEDEKYRDAQSTCYACHEEDDIHKGELGRQCQDCHETSGWTQSEFDHDKTDFKLKFAHQRVACNACHINEQYKDTPSRCVDCHAIRDIHIGRFGKTCETCHQERGWDQSIFDHNRLTRFDLEGRHRNQACNDCHSPSYEVSNKLDKLPRDCYSCHRRDDAHNGSNGKKCQDCHVPTGWHDAEFDHDVNTDFALNGAHEDLACEACHAMGAETKEIDTACVSCHQQDDAHDDEQGTDCAGCHNEIGWLSKVRFDHDLTNFPLIGQHAALGCESCHTSSVFREAGDSCNDCHRPDDVHREGLGEACKICHNSNAWLIWDFDHDETDFRLRHSHTEVHCHSCHNKPLRRFDSNFWRCVDCHRRDDVHDGNFGGACDRCHNEESFDKITIRSLNIVDGEKSEGSPE